MKGLIFVANTQLIQEFASYMRNVKNRSECTISAYCSDLAQFCTVMGVSDDFNGINQRDIENRYIANLVVSGISAASRARKLSSLKAFFKWAKSNGFVVENPVENVESPKIPHKEPKVMNAQDVDEVMIAVRNDGTTQEGTFRDIALISLMLNTGLRRAEVVNIKLNDLDLQNGSLLVHGKGSKERIVYFNDTTRAILSEFVLSHRKLMKPASNSPYLFVSRQSEKISVCQINNIINRHFESAGLKDKGYTVHSTRRTFASEAYRNTGDIFAVQKLLGHSNTQTTMRYVMAEEDMKRRAAMSVNF